MSLVASVKHGILDEEQRIKIREAFGTLSSHQAAILAFTMYVDARLAKLPPRIASTARKILANQKYGRAESRYLPLSREIENDTPDRYRNSIIDFSGQVHELEHVIQHHLVESSLGPSAYDVRGEVMFFLEELGAMSAEWDYLHSIPHEERERLALLIEKDKRMSKVEKNFALRTLRSASLSRAGYLLNEWKVGRYSRAAIKKLYKEESPSFSLFIPSILGFLGAGFSVAAVLITCENMREANTLDIQSTFYKSVCRNLLHRDAIHSYENHWHQKHP